MPRNPTTSTKPARAGASAADRRKFLALCTEGVSAREIARQTGFSVTTVSKWVRQDGGSFDRSRIAPAMRAKEIDLGAARVELAGKMMTAALSIMDRIESPYVITAVDPKSGAIITKQIALPPAGEQRNMMTTAGIAFDKATRIVEREPSVTGAESTLDLLTAGLRAAYDLAKGVEPVPTPTSSDTGTATPDPDGAGA